MRLPLGRPARRRSDHPRVNGSWLSLFAMWMIFIGPLIAQSMPMNHHAGMSLGAGMEGHAHAAPASDPQAHGAMHHGRQHDPQLHVLWEQCGYCSLLFNCPALPGTLSPLGSHSLPPAIASALPPLPGHATRTVFPGARSRAPPSPIDV